MIVAIRIRRAAPAPAVIGAILSGVTACIATNNTGAVIGAVGGILGRKADSIPTDASTVIGAVFIQFTEKIATDGSTAIIGTVFVDLTDSLSADGAEGRGWGLGMDSDRPEKEDQ